MSATHGDRLLRHFRLPYPSAPSRKISAAQVQCSVQSLSTVPFFSGFFAFPLTSALPFATVMDLVPSFSGIIAYLLTAAFLLATVVDLGDDHRGLGRGERVVEAGLPDWLQPGFAAADPRTLVLVVAQAQVALVRLDSQQQVFNYPNSGHCNEFTCKDMTGRRRGGFACQVSGSPSFVSCVHDALKQPLPS